MRAGARRHKCTIQTPTVTKTNGLTTTTWATHKTVMASIEQLSSYEKENAQASWPGADYKICFPYISGVTGNMRVVDEAGLIYAILGQPNDIDLRHRDIELTCQSGVKAS